MRVQPLLVALLSMAPIARAAEEHEDEGATPARISRDAGGDAVITLDAETQHRVGLAVTQVTPAKLAPSMAAYGRLELDPAESFTLRSPMTGYLVADSRMSWPGIGTVLLDGATVGGVRPRFSAMERFDLAARLMDARTEVEQTEAELSADRASYENKKKLNAAGRVVSDRVLEEAEARVKVDESRLASARRKVQLIEDELSESSELTKQLRLIVNRGGEVVEVLTQPGEAVESGQALLRVVQTGRLIARVELPLGSRLSSPIGTARIVPAGAAEHVLIGTWVGWAPDVGARTQGQGVLLAVGLEDPSVRPGTAVTAYLPGPGPLQTGVSFSRSALIRYGGLLWVYVKTSENTFKRVDVSAATPTEQGYFLPAGGSATANKKRGLSAGEHVVSTAAQMLLSEELRAQIEMEAEAEE